MSVCVTILENFEHDNRKDLCKCMLLRVKINILGFGVAFAPQKLKLKAI
jgi:hypothetical protein